MKRAIVPRWLPISCSLSLMVEMVAGLILYIESADSTYAGLYEDQSLLGFYVSPGRLISHLERVIVKVDIR